MVDASAEKSETRRVLAVHPGALGDVILFGHLLSQISGDITLVAQGPQGQLLKDLGIVRRLVEFDSLAIHEVFTDVAPAESKLAQAIGQHEVLVSCFCDEGTAAASKFSELVSAQSSWFLPVRPPKDYDSHLVTLWCEQLCFDVDVILKSGKSWSLPSASSVAASRELGNLGVGTCRPYVVLHPGAGGNDKCWPVERFVELGKRLSSRADSVFVLGPVEVDRWLDGQVEELASTFPTMICPELSTLAGVLAGASGYVGNDSGVGHLSAALGTATKILFGPTRAENFLPLGVAVKEVSAESMDAISVQRVMGLL